jgi:hypothetical protein
MWSWCGATMIPSATSVGRWCRHAGERRRSAARGCGGAAVLGGSPWTVGCPAGAAATRVRGTTTVRLRHRRRGQQRVELRTVPVPPSRLSPPFNPAHSNPHTPTTLLRPIRGHRAFANPSLLCRYQRGDRMPRREALLPDVFVLGKGVYGVDEKC